MHLHARALPSCLFLNNPDLSPDFKRSRGDSTFALRGHYVIRRKALCERFAPDALHHCGLKVPTLLFVRRVNAYPDVVQGRDTRRKSRRARKRAHAKKISLAHRRYEIMQSR